MKLSFFRRRSWKKHLAVAVTAGILAGAYAPGVMAADYSNKQIKGSLTSDQKTFGAEAVTKAEDGTLIYDLGEAMNFVNTSNAATVTNTIPSNLLVKNDVNIIVKGGDFGVNGISAGYSNPSFNKDGTKRATLTFDGNVTMRNKDVEGGWAITGSTIHGGYANYKGARWQPNAVRAGLLGDITFNGALDIAVKGSGLVTDPYYVAQNVDQYGTATINVNGNVNIDTPHEYTEAYYSVANYGGTINVNTDGANVGNSKVVLNGNIITMRDTEGEVTNPYFYRNGRTNIALTNEDSVWNGVIDNTSAAQTGEVNLWLQNGATWNHQAMSLTGGITLGIVPYPSNEHYGQYDSISHVNNLVGGKSAESSGYLYQKDSAAIDIANYSGYTTVYYEHINSGVNASDYAAGDITIQKAAADSGITLVTANNNVKDDQINLVLNALAGKLTYVDYSNNPNNLDATVKIASGLTADSITVKSGNIVFDSTGKGGYTNKVSEFKTTLTGDAETDTEYKVAGVLLEDGTYKFTDDSKIAVDGAAAVQADKAINVDATGKVLTLQVTNNEFGIAQSATTNPVIIKADKLDLSITGASVKAIASNNGSDTQAVTTINAATTVNASGSNTAYGVFANSNSEININGDTKITIDAPNASASWAAAGIRGNSYGQYAAVVNVNGDLSVKGNAVGLYVSGAGSTINTNGNVDISATADNMAALLAENGTINVNVKEDASKVVKIEGNAVASANFANYTNKVAPTEINLNLLNADSAWHGVAYNSFAAEGITTDMGTYTGAIDLALTNGATWTNEKVGELERLYEAAALGFTGSHVTTFKGGASAAAAGNIYQKDSNALTIDNYSGVTNVFYANDGATSGDFSAYGDTIIKHAAEKSAINLITTAPTSVTADSITSVLSALAGKLTYEAYAKNERNLTGTAKLAGGLTSDSVVMALGNIVFDENTGKGTGVSSIEATGPDHQVTTEFANTLTGDVNSDLAYVLGGVRQADGTYKFTDDSKIAVTGENARTISLTKGAIIDATGKSLTLDIAESTKYAHGIFHDAAEAVHVKADTLNINIKSTSDGGDGAQGIRNLQGDVVVDADVNIDVNGTNNTIGIYSKNGNFDVNGNLSVKVEGNNGGFGHYGASGVYATSSMGSSKGGVLNVNGIYTFEGNANGIYANSGGSVVNVEGGSIKVAAGQSKGYAALIAEDATINMNVVNGEATNNKVEVEGNVVVSTGATNENDIHGTKTAINLGLTTADSTLHGAVYNAFPEEGVAKGDLTFKGEANLWLQNGATWNNEVVDALTSIWGGAAFAGSHVTTFEGGASAAAAGNIYQKDSNALTIDNYSGVTNVFYANDGATSGGFSAYGDTIIKHAESGSAINLITTSNGALTSDSISGILTALAGKLTYAAYAENERNLVGTAKIAGGLTSDSVVMALGNIVFDEKTGKGNGISGIEIADAPEHQVATTINSTLTGDADNDLEYTLAGVLQKDGSYKFTEDSKIAVTGENARTISLTKGAIIDATGKSLTLDIAESTKYAHGIFHDAAEAVHVKADTLNINIKSTGDGSDGAQGIRNLQGDVILDANVNIDVNGTNNTIGIYSKNGNFDVNGNLNIKVEGNDGGFGHYGASGVYATSSMGSSKGGVLNVNGIYTFEGNANGIYANSGGSVVNVEGGSIKVAAGQSKGYAALIAEDATINMNVVNGEATNNKVEVEGNVVVSTGAVNVNDIHGTKTAINLGLTTADSTLHGAVYNAFPEEGVTKGDLTFTGEANLWLQNGATWNNEVVDALTSIWGGADFAGSHVTTFKGGASATAAGNIYQKDSNALTIDNYSGVTNVFYANDGTVNGDFSAYGDTIIKHAEAGSVVNLITNGDGSAAADINVVANILSALAGKLTYANYVDGERNLIGTVKLAGGLTADTVTWAVKDIVFDAKTGVGSIDKDEPIEFPEAPENQGATDFNSGLNGSSNLQYVYGGVQKDDGSYEFTKNTSVNVSQGAAVTADNEVKIDAQGQTLTLNVQPKDDGTAFGIMQTQAKDVNITAGTLEIKVLGGNGNEGIRLDNTDTENTANTNIKGNTDITLQGSASSKGITVNGNSLLNLQGDVTISNNSSSTGEAAGALAVGIYAGGNDSGKSAIVNVEGATSLTGAGTGVAVVGSASEVNLKGAVNISTSFDNMVAVVASSGTANINMASDGPSNNTVKLNGNLMVTRDADKLGDSGYQSVINVNMDNASSSWTGVAYNQFDEAAQVQLFALRRAVASTGEINLNLSNGAVWNNEALGIVPEEAATFNGSHITNLNGGTSYSSSGYIYQKDSNPLTIDNFNGSTILVYDHGDNDGTDVAHYAAGDTIINSAVEGSLITLSTDSRNINVNDRDNVDAVMSALSQKLAYAAAGSDNNLQGQVQISGGLTSDKIALWLGDLTFDAENGGLGQFTAGSSHRNYTTAECEFVQGTRTAIMSNMLSWRNVAASSYNLRNMRRGQEAKGGAGPVDMGSRLAGADEGTWARVYGGQTKYSGNNTSFDGDYWAAQVGYDKQLANGWTMGVAIDYQDGSDSYKTGSGDTKLYGLGFYGSKELAANSYLDLTARFGHVKNEFSASNETGKIDGDYSANGFSLSAQYSMRFGDDVKGYLEPQAQLTWARLGSSDFTAHGSLGSLHVNQDAMNSFVGRIGLEAGQASEHGNYFARISLAHEFAGDVDTFFVGSDGGTKATSYDLGGTWSELTVGGTFNLSKSLHFYGDVTKGLTGDYKQDWKVNAGLRFTF